MFPPGRSWLGALLAITLAGLCAQRAYSSEAVGPGASAPPDLARRVDALAAAVQARDSALSAVRGRALITRFLPHTVPRDSGLPEGHPLRMGSDLMERRRKANQRMDRDMAVARFWIDASRCRLEAQMLWWAGWFGAWFPMTPWDAERPADKTADLYYRLLCDGQYAHHVRTGVPLRDVRGSGYLRMPANSETVRATRGSIRGWIGIGLTPLSQGHRTSLREKPLSVREETLDGEKVWVLRWGVAGPAGPVQQTYWFAPEKGYALVRHEWLQLSEKRPLCGSRRVVTWYPLVECGGVWVPTLMETANYIYRASPQGGSHAYPGARERVTLSDLVVGEPVSFDMLADPMPLAGHTDHWPENVPVAESKRQHTELERVWKARSRFLNEPVPAPDPRFMQGVTTQQLEDLKRETGF